MKKWFEIQDKKTKLELIEEILEWEVDNDLGAHCYNGIISYNEFREYLKELQYDLKESLEEYDLMWKEKNIISKAYFEDKKIIQKREINSDEEWKDINYFDPYFVFIYDLYEYRIKPIDGEN